MTRNLTVIIQAEDDGFVALCPRLDVCRRLSNEVYMTQLEVAVG